MAKITFVTQDEQSITVEATSGSIMELAVDNNIPGIDGDCGGVCSCATCHVHVAAQDMAKTGTASEIESDMLELDDNVNEYSRLCCQIDISDDIDGITLKVVG
ncbi:2Fe-2S iron-sulfur cluster binding domain-containing protein [Psychrosphaera sp. B3R10]|uniref:2Fe-2S iron-sulfur cluster-binding protein n=1 Tax=unclassified Psychrosphaera TaxID=2641570 RepID=UPI001C09A8E1|nr:MULTISPECIES: 2Fe-2S iron-sulfur cluster-binding protein [unclassified Psychrosphaera]MBU2880764.1 2Fe-2S iron-sulfur cluster binding domain-containing protein [Psychrosphaera sp. I2R16]MBU2991490.1 2Fe-2S iron-sulfur cluster binding domain-containing protein [Psychrosphaera sp. B3R10]